MTETTETATETPTRAVADISDDDETTVRDRVWAATLALLSRRPIPFRVWRVRETAGLDECHDRTIRRTLSVMAAAGWLEHDENSPWWHPGPRADRLTE